MNEQSIGAREQAVLERLALLNPREGVAGALKAVEALRDDLDILPLQEHFNVARDAARQIQAKAATGTWLIDLLEQHLDQIGVPGVQLGLRQRFCAWLVRQLRPYLLDLVEQEVEQLRAEMRAKIAREPAFEPRVLTGTNGRVEVNGRPVRRFIGDS